MSVAVDKTGRFKDVNWWLAKNNGQIRFDESTSGLLAVLMDIRDELKRLNELLHCSNFITIPTTLRSIEHNTNKKPKKKAKP